jgi:excisionase family DNA binding protein
VKLLTSKLVGQILGFHARTVAQMGRRGELPGAVFIGRHVKFHETSIREFIERGGHIPRKDDPTSAGSGE